VLQLTLADEKVKPLHDVFVQPPANLWF